MNNIVSIFLFVSFQQFNFTLSQWSYTNWNFTSVNLPESIFISKFAVWKSRTFLAIPRQQDDVTNHLTLWEAPWPEKRTSFTSIGKISSNITPFPVSYAKSFPLLDNECHYLQSVVAVDVDYRRLWVLDVPKRNCSAKIVIYDLTLNDKEVTTINLTGVLKRDLNALVVDPMRKILHEPRAFIGDPGDESIIVFNLYQRKWWKLKLVHKPDIPRVYTSDIAISRKNRILFLTGPQTDSLFSIKLDTVGYYDGLLLGLLNENYKNISVKWLGFKLGASTGLLCDDQNGLHYFVTSQHASVRWDITRRLRAESHSVVLQNEYIPYITHYIEDSQKSVWGIVNSWLPIKPRKTRDKQSKLKSRTVKIDK